LSSEGWNGISSREAARRFAVSESTAIKLARRVCETGTTVPARIGGYRKPLLPGHEDLLRALTATKNKITLAEVWAALVARGIEAGCLTTSWSTLRRLGLSHKNLFTAAEQDRPDVVIGRRPRRSDTPSWTRSASRSSMRLASTNMLRRYGWAELPKVPPVCRWNGSGGSSQRALDRCCVTWALAHYNVL